MFVNKETVIPQIDKNIFVFVKNELRIPGYIIDEINVERNVIFASITTHTQIDYMLKSLKPGTFYVQYTMYGV